MQTCRIKLQHNHIADTAVVQCAIAVDKIKLRAACLRDKPAVIVAEGLKDLPDTARCAMLSANSIKRTLQLSDCSTSAQTAIAKHLHHPRRVATRRRSSLQQIPAIQLRTTERFVHCSVHNRQQRLNVLCSSGTWFMDGNFAMSPQFFLQVSCKD